jgi:transcriptional antiterminator RfaH
MKRWYLLYTKPRREKLALQNLQNQGYQGYLPYVKIEKIRQGARGWVEQALFPRYLFVKLDDSGSQSWVPIRSTVGVSDLVRFGDHFAHVSDDLVSWIEECATNTKIGELFKEGDVLVLTQGPFRGMEAVFKTYDGERRVILLLNLLAKVTEGSFSLDFVKKATLS